MLNQKERLRVALDLRPGEGGLVGLLLAHSLLQGVALAYFFTAANGLFLESLEFSYLAYVYLAAGVVSGVFALIYARLEHMIAFNRLLQWSVVVLVPVVLLLRLLYAVSDPAVTAFLLLVWYHVMHYLIDSRFWELSAVLFDVRQSKRLFGIVSLGETVAKVIGYMSVPLLVYLAGTENLLVFAAIALVLSLPALRKMLARYGDKLAIIESHAHDSHDAHGGNNASHAQAQTPSLRDRRYFLLLLLFTLFSFSALAFLEYGFLSGVQNRFHNDGEIAPFLGVFFGAGKALNIIARAFLSGRFIRRYGLLVGLTLLPVLLLALSLAIIGVPFLSDDERWPLLLFGCAVLFSEVLRGPLANMAYLILFQPLSPKRRLDAHMLAKAKGEPAALVLAGLALIVITGVTHSILYVSIGLGVLMLGWIIVSILVEREYLQVIRESLRKRVLRGSSLELSDPATMAILESRIRSDDPAEAIYALSLLAQGGHESLEEYLLELAAHQSASVRVEALRKIDELGLRAAEPLLAEMIDSEPDPKIRGYAVTVYCVVAGERAVARATALLDDVQRDVAAGAMIGLLRNGGLQGVIAAGQRLMALTASPIPADRALAARVIGDVGNPGFYSPLLPLFSDPDRGVSEAAIRASGAVGNPALIEPLTRALVLPRVAEAAAGALVRNGETALPAIRALFESSDDPKVLRRICRIAERIGGDGAVGILTSAFLHHRRDVRDQAATSIALGVYTESLADTTIALTAIKAELADAAVMLMEMRQLGRAYGRASHDVLGALRYEVERLRNRILLLLSLAFDRRSILRARDRLSSHDPGLRANAIEILELTVTRSLVDQVLPLFEERDHEQQYTRLASSFPHATLAPESCLEEIIANKAGRHSAWTRACALRLAAAENLAALDALLPQLLESHEGVVRETAETATSSRNPESLTETTMVSTIEKVMTLKLTDMFNETPEEILTDVAGVLQEVYVPAGETIIHKGEPGNCMYIIHSGNVRVHDGDHEFGRFTARDHFGELSLLDPEPRSASVTAVEDTHLLRLDQDALYEIMADSIEVARGILRTLTRRLRAQNVQIMQLEGAVKDVVE